MNRGDVVIVPFPFQDKPGQKIRPAVNQGPFGSVSP
jgi:hypothetical protein